MLKIYAKVQAAQAIAAFCKAASIAGANHPHHLNWMVEQKMQGGGLSVEALVSAVARAYAEASIDYDAPHGVAKAIHLNLSGHEWSLEWRGDTTITKVSGCGGCYAPGEKNLYLEISCETTERGLARAWAAEEVLGKNVWHPDQKEGWFTAEEAFLVASGKATINSFDEVEVIEEEGEEVPASPGDQL